MPVNRLTISPIILVRIPLSHRISWTDRGECILEVDVDSSMVLYSVVDLLGISLNCFTLEVISDTSLRDDREKTHFPEKEKVHRNGNKPWTGCN